MNKPNAIIPPTPAGAKINPLQFYVGRDDVKIKAVDATTGARFTVAYLFPTLKPYDPIKRELALDFAALATQAPNLLRATESLLGFVESFKGCTGTMVEHEVYDRAEAMLADFHKAVAIARRLSPTDGIMGEELAAAVEAQFGGASSDDDEE
jgi:hypothetical protein